MERDCACIRPFIVGYPKPLQGGLFVLLLTALCGCSTSPKSVTLRPAPGESKTFELKEIAAEQARASLSELGLGTVTILPSRNAVAVTGSASDLHRVSVVLDLVDTRSKYVIATVAPTGAASRIPSNQQIGAALGGVALGTFAHPPDPNARLRGIIDIHGDSLVAIVPACLQEGLLALVKHGPGDSKQTSNETIPAEASKAPTTAAESNPPAPEPNGSQDGVWQDCQTQDGAFGVPCAPCQTVRDQSPAIPRAGGLEAATPRAPGSRRVSTRN